MKALRVVVLLALVGSASQAAASHRALASPICTDPGRDTHFRYANLSWVPLGDQVIAFQYNGAWRRNGYNGSGTDGHPCPGDVISEGIGSTSLEFGDGTRTGQLKFRVTAVDVANNWLFSVALDPDGGGPIIHHQYAANGDYTAFVDSCCRISQVLIPNAHINNPDGDYRLETIVNVGSGNSSPTSTLPPIVSCRLDSLCSFTIPASDPDGDLLQFRLSGPDEAGTDFIQPGVPFAPNDAAIEPGSGLYTWDTTDATTAADVGCPPCHTLYSTQVTIEDYDQSGNLKSKVPLDFFIELVTQAGKAPVFDGASLRCGRKLLAMPTQELDFTIRAFHPNPGDGVELNAVGLPTGARMDPPLPLRGHRVESTFSWTPPLAQGGQGFLVVFTALDAKGFESLCPVPIQVLTCRSGDSDCDGLSDVSEQIRGTDPLNVDTDGDGLLDPWEVEREFGGQRMQGAGFNIDSDPKPEATRDEVFEPYSSQDPKCADPADDPVDRIPEAWPCLNDPPDPLHKDVYVEIDWQDCTLGGCPELFFPGDADAVHHAPDVQGLRDVIGAFAAAPVENPDGNTGINLHVLVDQPLAHQPNCQQADSFDHLWTTRQYNSANWLNVIFAKARTFRYVWSGHSTARADGVPDPCPKARLGDLALQGLGLADLSNYEATPFGDTNADGVDMAVSLGSLWLCRQGNAGCLRDLGAIQHSTPLPLGVFPATVDGDPFPRPSDELLGLDPSEGLPQRQEHFGQIGRQEGVRQLWGRTLMHLLGHSLGLQDEALVLNQPDVPGVDIDGNGTVDEPRPPDPYADWTDLDLSVPDGMGFPLPHEALPVQDPSQGQDLDGDSVPEAQDNCPGLANPDQANLDGDALGDSCDPDIDNDLLVNSIPNPIRTGPGAGQGVDAFPFDTDNDGIDNVADDDDDGDGVADAVENCALVPNADQHDLDGDGSGDACDVDADADGFPGVLEDLAGSDPLSAASIPEFRGIGSRCGDGIDDDLDGRTDADDEGCLDSDGDSLPDFVDNCPTVPNPGWLDGDADGVGDDCEKVVTSGHAFTRYEDGTVNVLTTMEGWPGGTLTGEVDYRDKRLDPPGGATHRFRCVLVPNAVRALGAHTAGIRGAANCSKLPDAATFSIELHDAAAEPLTQDSFRITLRDRSGGVVYLWNDLLQNGEISVLRPEGSPRSPA